MDFRLLYIAFPSAVCIRCFIAVTASAGHSWRRSLTALLVARLVGLYVDARVPAAQPPVPLSSGYRAPAGVADMRFLCRHRLAAVLVDEPLKRIRDEPGAVVLVQVAVGLGAHVPGPPYRSAATSCSHSQIPVATNQPDFQDMGVLYR